MVDTFDAVIVGGGPAGLSCALELHDSKLSCLVLEKGQQLGGTLPEIKNTIRNFVGGFYDDGEDLRDRLVDLCNRMQINYVTGARVESVDLDKRSVFTKTDQYVGRTLVIATGCRTRKLGLPGESMFKDDIFYYTEGNEHKLQGKSLAVIGGGDNALMECIGLSKHCPCIYLIHRSKALRARPDVIESVKSNPVVNVMLSTEIDSLSGTKELKGIQVISSDDGKVLDLPVEKMIVKVGYAPNTELFRGQVNMNNAGHIAVNEFCECSVPNVFAVGDCVTPSYPRIATAVGHGAIAAGRIRSILEKR